jgi:hypothetical protein
MFFCLMFGKEISLTAAEWAKGIAAWNSVLEVVIGQFVQILL